MYTEEILVSFGKIALAAVLGGVIGFERESKGQFAGFRTILLISIGSCLMMMLSLHMPLLYESMGADSVLRIDPARIASYAIASMGFLGGGAIIKGRGSVRGLTTAASLWLVTGLGLSVGAGFYIPAILCALISIVVLYNMSRFKILVPHRQFVTPLRGVHLRGAAPGHHQGGPGRLQGRERLVREFSSVQR